jgi:hypothetical protein
MLVSIAGAANSIDADATIISVVFFIFIPFFDLRHILSHLCEFKINSVNFIQNLSYRIQQK